MPKQEDIIKVENGRLIVDVALDGTNLSTSQKNIVKFSTHGNIKVNGVTIGINAYVKA